MEVAARPQPFQGVHKITLAAGVAVCSQTVQSGRAPLAVAMGAVLALAVTLPTIPDQAAAVVAKPAQAATAAAAS
jgi:hypothetical protein